MSSGQGAAKSEITEEMVASAHAEYCHTGSDTRWRVRMRRAIQAALAARPIEAGSVKIQRYELTPHGTLKEAADGWWTSADAAEAAIAERDERMKDLEDAILACEKGDALDVLANYRAVRRTIHATRAALQQEGESDV